MHGPGVKPALSPARVVVCRNTTLEDVIIDVCPVHPIVPVHPLHILPVVCESVCVAVLVPLSLDWEFGGREGALVEAQEPCSAHMPERH